MKYTKKVPYFKKGDKIDKAARNLPKKQKEAVLKVSSAQKEQERKDKLNFVGAGFKRPTAEVITPDTRSAQIKNTVGQTAARTFGEAFQQARARGDSEFLWKGNRYHTRTAEEEAERKAKESKTKESKTNESETSESETSESETKESETSESETSESETSESETSETPTRSQDIEKLSRWSQDIEKLSAWSVIPTEGKRPKVPTKLTAMPSAVSTPLWITNPTTRLMSLIKDKHGNWITRPVSDKYGHIIQGPDSTWSFYQQGGTINKSQRKSGWLFQQGGQIPKFQQGDKLHLRNIWERMFGITPDYTPVNSQESITSYMDNTHKGPVEKRVIRKEVPYANLHSTMSIRNPGTNRADTTFTTPSGTRYDMNDVRSGKAPSGYSYKFFRKPAGYFQQGGNIENKQAVLIADFVVRYLKGLGVPEENIISSDGSLNQEHVPAVQEVLAEIGDSAEFWSMYEQNPDEVISQYIQSKNPGAAQMARKGAKLKRLSQLRIYKK